MELEPVSRAAWDGDAALVEELVTADPSLLNMCSEADICLGVSLSEDDCVHAIDCTPLMIAAWMGHDSVVERLLALGADVALQNPSGYLSVHGAAAGHATCLALLIDAGAPLNARTEDGSTPLMEAAFAGADDCVELLLARGGDALGLDAAAWDGDTALHVAASCNQSEIVRLLLRAGADPTIRNNQGRTALNVARRDNYHTCIPLLEAAVAAPEYPRTLFKARALLDAAYAVPDAAQDAADKGEPVEVQLQASLAAAPAYLKDRVQNEHQLPRVLLAGPNAHNDEELLACLKYALGLEGRGGVHPEGQPPPPPGMPPELFTELLELLVPKWDPSREGLPLGEGLVEEDEEEGSESGDDEEEGSDEDEA